MRITAFEKDTIKELVKNTFSANAKVYLFGSRVDDSKKGGDIDLLIECQKQFDSLKSQIAFITDLQNSIGEQKIDVIVKSSEADSRLVVKEALQKGILL